MAGKKGQMKRFWSDEEKGNRCLAPTFRCRQFSASPCLMDLKEFLHGWYD